MSKVTPMMEQYLNIKKQYKYCLLFYRLGDFYELFFDDAKIASKVLNITLTERRYGGGQKADMCGVPHHSAHTYIAKLLHHGYKVAICEQVEDPKASKGIVKREVIRVITPGTVIDPLSLEDHKNNYICAVFNGKEGYGLAFADVTTGEFQVTAFDKAGAAAKLVDELEKFHPSEIICMQGLKEKPWFSKVENRIEKVFSVYEDWAFEKEGCIKMLQEHFKVLSLDGFGLKDNTPGICAAGALMNYLHETQKNGLDHINKITVYTADEFMSIDASSRRNLELTQTLSDKSKKGTLLWTLDYTNTAMGARLLRRFIEQPLTKQEELNQRYSAVEELKEHVIIRSDTRDYLRSMYDMERLVTRVIYNTANARDMIALRMSFENLPRLKEQLQGCQSSYLKLIGDEMDDLADLHHLIYTAVKDEPPVTLREGGIIKAGYNREVDKYRLAWDEGESWIKQFEEKERENTGIKNLKVKSNKIFGYYIEITKSNIGMAPEDYIRKQTLANCERYTTGELQQLESKIMDAAEHLVDLEYDLFCEVRNYVAENAKRIQKTAHLISLTDVIQSFAEAAERQNYTKPVLVAGNVLNIKGGRHPVVEKMSKTEFIPNDTFLDGEENRLIIITGPNMAGKSTYMRQTALIALMAQIGSFVPADYCEMSIVDKIFTRVGASDDLAAGQSTFMMEMTEVANILHNATANSLVILDEIGRGTSTFDGLSIAWAVLEYITDKKQIGAKTLFATHYHELTELEGKLAGVKNFCITVKEQEDDIIFLRKIERGGAGRSLGVAVAKLAGLPEKVVTRSNEILHELNDANITKKSKKIIENAKHAQENKNQPYQDPKLRAFVEKVKTIDVLNMSPMNALEALFQLQDETKEL